MPGLPVQGSGVQRAEISAALIPKKNLGAKLVGYISGKGKKELLSDVFSIFTMTALNTGNLNTFRHQIYSKISACLFSCAGKRLYFLRDHLFL